jgi:hypothetical protein
MLSVQVHASKIKGIGFAVLCTISLCVPREH